MSEALSYRTTPFMSGRSQAVRIPKPYRFDDNEQVVVNRIGNSVIITPIKDLAETFYSGINMLTPDFVAAERPEEVSDREVEL